jgi:trimeric autotransporter adhesin
MSTKTLRKRIALVAVSALGFGLVGAAPSSAAEVTTTNVTASATAGAQVVGVAGTIGTATGGAQTTGAANDNTVASIQGPAGAVVTFTEIYGADITDDNVTIGNTGTITNGSIDDAGNSFTTTANSSIVASFSLPGVYTVGIGGDTDTITVRVLPSTSLTTSLTAVPSQSGQFVTGTNPVITVVRNTGGNQTDGTILARVDATADTDLTVGEILGETVEAADVTIAASGEGRAFTFLNATIATAGTYTFTFWSDANANNALDSGEVSTTGSFTIAAAAASTSLISASLSRTVGHTTAGLNTVTVTATITDSLGRPTTGNLRVAETDSTGTAYVAATANINGAGFTTAPNATGTSGALLARVGTTNTYTGTFTIDQEATGDFFDTYLTVYIDGTIAADATTSAKAALRIVNLGALTTVAGVPAASVTDAVGIGTVTAGVKQTLTGTSTTDIAFVSDRTVLSHVYTFNAAAGSEGEYIVVQVTPSATTPASVLAPALALVAIGADLTARYTVTTVAPATTSGYTLTATATTDVASVVTYATAAPTWSVSPSSNIRAKFGDSITVTGSLADQFGRVVAAAPVSVIVAGRQAGTYLGTTDATGSFDFTWKDVNAATTVTLTDSLTFNYSYLASATATTTTNVASSARTVTYSATGIAVGSVLVAAPSATNTRPIDMDAAVGRPAAGSVVTYTASVRDAAGLPVVAGALVTFTGGADDLFVGGRTGVTDEFGQASVVVYRTKVGAPAITATAGGVTSPVAAAVLWTNDVANNTAASAPNASSAKRQARYITLAADVASVVSAGIIRFTATVTDRWGNAVDGAQVTFAETGAGRFYNPPTSNQVVTNAAGQASIDLNSQAGETGAVSVTATITESTALQAINEDAAGFITNIVADATPAYTGTLTAVAGVTAAVKSATATATITKDTSTSTADALLALAQALGTRDQASAAIDAAAEATDASNAATDAANAAAEAADAATAAAQDAADAVAALSTQVSEMVAALKKQITSLTNLVIKIQRKVRA